MALTFAPEDLDPYRLPTWARPVRYDVRLRPSLDDSTFLGSVSIQLDLDAPAEALVLNAAELDIVSCSIDGDDARWELDEENERLLVFPADPLTRDRVRLRIEFSGILNDRLRGFYRSTYRDDEGVEHVIATTQMQSTDCRRAFPCWDEPEYKAVFGITLDVADGLTAISNGPEVERTSAEGRTVIRFADTMVMSSYLVAFVVGELEMTEAVDVDGIPLRVVHVPGKGHLTEFGLDVGAFSLRFFQDYYGIAYPSDKVDLVALPDFAAGAMENLGCITFRESLLLVDPERSTQNEQQLVADVVAHELAHMWFGDLVTMRWWNGIWLNEAFATFMEIAACAAYRPDWERWTSFGLERSVAYNTDSLASTRSVEYEVRSPQDCEGMFDVLTYQKGAALVRMLEQYLGEQRFREGVSHYLRAHSYANTETNDLWDAIEATSGDPVRRIMDSWIWQPGYPLVSASLSPDGATLTVEQHRFRFDVDDAAASDTTWVIPAKLRIGDDTTTLLLDGRRTEVAVTTPGAPIVVNAGGDGFFRVAYDAELRGRFTTEVLASASTLERFNLVDDAWAATIAGRMSAVEMLEWLGAFSDETDFAVWQAIVGALRGLSRLVDGDALDALRVRIRSMIEPVLSSLGGPAADEPDLTGKLRGLLTSTMGVLGGDEATIDRCRSLFAAADDDPDGIDPELVAAATAVVAANGDADTYDTMLDGFRNGATPQAQLRHLYALAEFDDADLVRRTCDLAFSDDVKSQNAPFLIRLVIANRQHGELAWGIVRERWAEANARFPKNTIVRMIESVALLTSPEAVHDVQSFFTEHPIEQSINTQRQILERQLVNAALRDRDSESLAVAL
ncbi:MAG: M1 family metallopeptidase [Actinomycetota bacterium]